VYEKCKAYLGRYIPAWPSCPCQIWMFSGIRYISKQKC